MACVHGSLAPEKSLARSRRALLTTTLTTEGTSDIERRESGCASTSGSGSGSGSGSASRGVGVSSVVSSRGGSVFPRGRPSIVGV
jgi:hypothetical protein